MSKLASVLLMLVAMASCIQTSMADEISDLEDRLVLLDKQIAVANKKKVLLGVEAELAVAKKGIAAAELEIAQKALQAAQERLKLPATLIEIMSGELAVINKPFTCDAAPFLKWKCQREVGCEFTVDQNICGVPAGTGDPMVLSLIYRCGDEQINDAFGWGKPAHLTCK